MVVVLHPLFQGGNEFHRTLPLVNPDQLFFQGPHQPFRVCIAFWMGIAGERLRDARGSTGLQKGHCRGLAHIIGHQ